MMQKRMPKPGVLTRTEKNFLRDALHDYWDGICAEYDNLGDAGIRRLANVCDRVYLKLGL